MGIYYDILFMSAVDRKVTTEEMEGVDGDRDQFSLFTKKHENGRSGRKSDHRSAIWNQTWGGSINMRSNGRAGCR